MKKDSTMKRFLKYIKSTRGQSLAEFAVTTAMMATLATTAAPKFSGVGEGAKEKKTLADIDKIMKSANNFYNAKVTSDGRGRFPGQNKYNETVPATGGPTQGDRRAKRTHRLAACRGVDAAPAGGHLGHRRRAAQGPDRRDRPGRRVAAWPSGAGRRRRCAQRLPAGHQLTRRLAKRIKINGRL